MTPLFSHARGRRPSSPGTRKNPSSASFVSVCIGIALCLRAGACFFYGGEFFSSESKSKKKREKAEGCKKASARDFYGLFLLAFGGPSS